MSQNITLNSQVYIIPDVGETGWGQNLTNYFVAIPAGVLQKSAGLFTLTADVDFGASFGIDALYYKSRTASIATAGQVRLAKTDTIDFRNNANSANLALGIDSSDRLTFNGTPIESNVLTSAHIFVGNASNVATDVAMSGDVSITNTGATAVNNIQAGVVTNTMVNAAAAIAITKLANGTADQVFGTNHTGTANEFKTLTGTTNQVVVTGSAGAITFATPQDINTSSSPTFSGLTISKNATAEVLTKTTLTTAVGELYAQNDLSNGIQVGSYGSAFGGTTNGRSNSGLGFIGADKSTFIYTGSVSTFLSFGINNVEQLYIDSTGLTLTHALNVANGGTGDTSFTAYSVICGGTTTTGALQNVSGLGSSGQVLTSNGAAALPSWTNAPGTGTVNSGTQYQLAFYATSTNAVSGNSKINTNVNNDLLLTSTSTTALKVNTNDLVVDGTNHRVGIGITAPGYPLQVQADAGAMSLSVLGRTSDDLSFIRFADHTDATVQGYIFASPTAMTLRAGPSTAAIIAKTSGVAVLGTNTNDTATSGYIGETVEASQTFTNFPATTVYGDLTSISLTAGDWLVTATYWAQSAPATGAVFLIGISTTSGNSSTGLTQGTNFAVETVTIAGNQSMAVPSYRVSLASTTTVYLKYQASYASGTPQAQGHIIAVRIR